jgi:hypothetical protein
LRIYVHEADRDLATTAKSFGKNERSLRAVDGRYAGGSRVRDHRRRLVTCARRALVERREAILRIFGSPSS